MIGRGFLSTAETAHRLGVKPQTVYAYVSRGLLTSVRLPGHRGSAFAVADVDALVVRGRARRVPSGAIETIGSAITALDNDELYYRGRRVQDLVPLGYEAAAELLWSGAEGPRTWPEPPGDLVDAVMAAWRTLLVGRPSRTGCVSVSPFSPRWTARGPGDVPVRSQARRRPC